MPNQGTIHTVIKDTVAYLEFFHPSSNSFPGRLLQQLTEEIQKISQNPAVTIVVLQSKGTGAFCAGASFDELLAVDNLIDGTQFFSGFANVINAMRKCSKIIVGRCHGKAVGGGVGLLAACDIVYAVENSAVKLSEIAIGIGPFVIEPVVSKKIGKVAMTEMTLAPKEWKNAVWALEKGLFSKVSPTVEQLDNGLFLLTEEMRQYNPEALYEMKKVIWEGTEHWDTLLYERAAVSGRLVLSEFTKNALNQFKK